MPFDRSIVRAQALAVRAMLDPARGGLPAKVLAFEIQIPEATLRSWAKDDPAAMPLGALWKLAGTVPAEQLNLLLPDGLLLVRVPEGADHDALVAGMQAYLAQYVAARHPASEAGTELGAGELAKLDDGAAAVVAIGSVR
jgi:hypothetical protein